MTVNVHGVKVGDVFHESWGYDQTNADFYQVVAVTPKSVRIRKIHARRVGTGHSTRLAPDVDNFVEPAGYLRPWNHYGEDGRQGKGIHSERGALKRTNAYSHNGERHVYLNMTSYSSASLITDPDATFFDTIAAGYPGH